MRKSTELVVAMSVVLAVAFAITLSTSAQNPGSVTPTNKNQSEPRSIGTPQKPDPAQPDFSKNTWELPDDADRTKNPVASSAESIERGKELYLDSKKGNCVFCHGENGSGNEANLPKLRRKPADLSDSERMSMMTDGEVFWKISKGINMIMPAGEKRMTEEERWDVVNYVRTLAKVKAMD
jgi:mono/diheme cytochrome c family protein